MPHSHRRKNKEARRAKTVEDLLSLSPSSWPRHLKKAAGLCTEKCCFLLVREAMLRGGGAPSTCSFCCAYNTARRSVQRAVEEEADADVLAAARLRFDEAWERREAARAAERARIRALYNTPPAVEAGPATNPAGEIAPEEPARDPEHDVLVEGIADLQPEVAEPAAQHFILEEADLAELRAAVEAAVGLREGPM